MSSSSHETVQVFSDSVALTRAAAQDFVTFAKEAGAAKGFFSVALSGGSTPKRLHQLLAAEADGALAAPWDQIHLFFGDERHVGASSDSQELH